MENVYAPENEAGVWQWLLGKSVTSIVLHNTGSVDGFVGIAAPTLARILPVSCFPGVFGLLEDFIIYLLGFI